jgi:hypothetical protein
MSETLVTLFCGFLFFDGIRVHRDANKKPTAPWNFVHESGVIAGGAGGLLLQLSGLFSSSFRVLQLVFAFLGALLILAGFAIWILTMCNRVPRFLWTRYEKAHESPKGRER